MITLPQRILALISIFKKSGYEAFVVGGSVRNLLLGREVAEWDFTTNATPEHILKLFPKGFYDNDFGTVGVPYETDGKSEVFEITTYRSESGYHDKRRPSKVLWGKKLEEDLSRRDFTINAIAFDGQHLIDPFNGQADLAQKLIRTVGEADARFDEDALRLLRAVRIATQLQFTIEDATAAAIKKHAPSLHHISADRIRHELMKIIASDHAADGIVLLKNNGLLEQFLPEVYQAFGVAQKSPGRHHVYDVGTHLVMSLHHCPSVDPVTRFATLLHDIGKVKTYRKDQSSGMITFYNHEVEGARQTEKIATRLNFSKIDREKLVTLVRWHQFTVDEEQTDATLRRFIKRVGKEYLKDILDLRIGDRLGGGAAQSSWRLRLFMSRLEEVQKQPFTVSDLKINGHDVMKVLGISPGPRIGEVLNKLFDKVVLGMLKNERAELLAQLKLIKID